MDDQSRLISWLLSHADQLRLKVQRLTWCRDVLPDFNDVLVEIEIDGRRFPGFGADQSEDHALVKAAAEALERYACRITSVPTSNGVAAHTDFVQAAKNAASELVERDQLLCRFHSGIGFPAEECRDLPESLVCWYQEHGIVSSVFRNGQGGYIFMADGRRSRRPFGFVIGLGNRGTRVASISHAAIEATRQVVQVVASSAPIAGLTLAGFAQLREVDFPDHGRLALDLSYANQIEFLFKPGNTDMKTEPLTDINVMPVEVGHPLLKDCPIQVAHASSPKAQGLYLGMPTKENLNIIRLAKFGPVDLRNKMMSLPHPLN